MIRILVVDDHRLFRMGLVRMLRDVKGLQIMGEAATGEEAISKAREMRPNIVLMDIVMPGIGGIEATRRIVCSNPDVKVIALTACNEEPFPLQMLKAGASGYLTKEIDPEELNLAIRKVFLGKRYLCAAVAHNLAIRSFDEHESPFEQLSSREMQIMMMVISCQKVSAISVNLHLSPKTVNSYRYRIFEKLRVSSDVELALLAVRHGMVGPRVQHAAHGA